MEDVSVILQKGKSIKFLDYTIKNSLNNDGLVLFKKSGELHETHLGNYGEGNKQNIDYCKRDAVLHFMIARPAEFASTILNKIKSKNSGTMHEYFLLKNACEAEKLQLPHEITCGDETNCMIYFNNNPLIP